MQLEKLSEPSMIKGWECYSKKKQEGKRKKMGMLVENIYIIIVVIIDALRTLSHDTHTPKLTNIQNYQ